MLISKGGSGVDMQIRIDGSRSSSDNWLIALLAPTSELPRLSPEEERAAEKMRMSTEDYARSRYAMELSAGDLEQRAGKLGTYIQGWLAANGVDGTVERVWLKTLEGKYRIEIDSTGRRSSIIADEDLIDDLFERGSSTAQRELGRLLMVNLLPFEAAQAS